MTTEIELLHQIVEQNKTIIQQNKIGYLIGVGWHRPDEIDGAVSSGTLDKLIAETTTNKKEIPK